MLTISKIKLLFQKFRTLQNVANFFSKKNIRIKMWQNDADCKIDADCKTNKIKLTL